ncbi:MAG: MerR family DNA-binding protein [Gammaproteobacteria bacterium]
MDGTGQIAIGRLARHTGTNVETIRPTTNAWASGRLPRRARLLGFSIGEVRTLLRLADERKRPCADVRVVAEAHLADVRIRSLT